MILTVRIKTKQKNKTNQTNKHSIYSKSGCHGMTIYPAPIQLGHAGIGKFPFFGCKNILRHVLEVTPNITAMVNLLPKPLKK